MSRSRFTETTAAAGFLLGTILAVEHMGIAIGVLYVAVVVSFAWWATK